MLLSGIWVTMIILAGFIIYFTDKNGYAKIRLPEWTLLIMGSVITIISYTEEYVGFMLSKFSAAEIFDFSNAEKLMEFALEYIPADFQWWIYIVGEVMFFMAILIFWRRNRIQT